jgi:general secretion pathway protein B
MSFILDALRKSEHERRMETSPDIMHTPVAVSPEPLPGWVIPLIGTLAAALLVVTIYTVWQRFSDPEPAAVTTAVPIEPAQPQSAARPVQPAPTPAVTAPAPARPAVVTPPQPTPAEPAVSVQTQREPVGSEPVAAEPMPNATAASAPVTPTPVAAQPPAPPATAPAPAPPPARERLPSYASVVSEGMDVGVLQMQLHVHSSTPSNRFVVINGSRSREGDRLSAGPTIEEIVAEGAILSYQGRRFLLPPN